jgi:hypothetical protein
VAVAGASSQSVEGQGASSERMQTVLAAFDFGAPTPVVIAIVILVVGLLLIRFVLKTAFTLLKIGILVAIGVAVYLGVNYLLATYG